MATRTLKHQNSITQGAIIYRPSADDQTLPRRGFILTADCDIAQDKSGERLSYLQIVTAHHYLEHVWAAEALRKTQSRALDNAAALATSASKRLDETLNAISPADILEWLESSSVGDIVTALQIEAPKSKLHHETFEIVELCFNIRSAATALERLRRVWSIQKTSLKEVRARLEQALDQNKALDIHLLPTIEGFKQFGYVILLREVYSISRADLHGSALDLMINGKPNDFHIVCPSSDNLRYAVAQKMAYLFSRIGLANDFETECGVAIQLAIEELLEENRSG